MVDNCSISEVGEHRLEVTRDSPLKWGVTREELGCAEAHDEHWGPGGVPRGYEEPP